MSATMNKIWSWPRRLVGSVTVTVTRNDWLWTALAGAVKVARDVVPLWELDWLATTPGPDQVWRSWRAWLLSSSAPVATRLTVRPGDTT